MSGRMAQIIEVGILFLALLTGIQWGQSKIGHRALQTTQQRVQQRLDGFREEPVTYGKKYRIRISQTIRQELVHLPYPESYRSNISVSDSWGAERTTNANSQDDSVRMHEGSDLMYDANRRGEVPILSMTDGVVEQKGWLTLGGYRIGIRSESGVYYYYAHLASYVDGLQKGDSVSSGQLLGFMGDTGYGEEGTTGKFPVHLHVGIYVNQVTVSDLRMRWLAPDSGLFFATESTAALCWQEVSINPYPYLLLMMGGE